MIRKRIAWLPFALLFATAGCGGSKQAGPEGEIVSPKLPGSSVASPTAGDTTGGEDGSETGGTGTGGTDEESGGPDSALIMNVINSVLK